jgi:hypothetical protein
MQYTSNLTDKEWRIVELLFVRKFTKEEADLPVKIDV